MNKEKMDFKIFVSRKPQSSERPESIPFYIDRLIEEFCCGTCKICWVKKPCHEAIKGIQCNTQQQSREQKA